MLYYRYNISSSFFTIGESKIDSLLELFHLLSVCFNQYYSKSDPARDDFFGFRYSDLKRLSQ